MEGLAILIAIAALGSLVLSPILALVALSRARRLRDELDSLKRTVRRLREDGEAGKAPPSPAAAAIEPQAARAAPPRPEPRFAEAVAPTAATPGAPPPPVPATPAAPAVAAYVQPAAAPPRTEAAPPPPARPRDTATMEEKLGARLTVWIGAVAFVLAAVFLVKYAFDNNLLTPATRVTLSAIFGAVLLGAGEWFRRSLDRIAQGLSASGVAALYASVVAAASIYHLIGQTIAFGFVFLITATAVILSLRQGMIVALVGLVGGFLMPALLHTDAPKPAALFSYLLLLELGLIAVTFKRKWWALSLATLVASMVWAVVWIAGMHAGTFPVSHGLWVGLFLILSSAAFVITERAQKTDDNRARFGVAGFFSWIAMGSGLVLTAFLTGAAHYSWREWAFLWVLSAGGLVLGRLDPTKEGLAGLAALLGAGLLAVWHSQGLAAGDELRFGIVALAFGLLHAGGGYACLWGSVRPLVWAVLSSVSAFLYCLVAYRAIETLPSPLSWGSVSLIVASLAIAGAFPIGKRRERLGSGPLGAYAVAATTFITLAVPLELERQWITVAWALELVALAWLEGRLALPVMRILAAITAVAVGVRLLLNPAVLTYPIGELVLVNWLLYGYGIPVLAAAWAARIFRGAKDDWLVHGLEGLAVALGFALLALQTRQYFHPADLDCSTWYLAEWGSLAIAWMAYGLVLDTFARRFPRPSLRHGGLIAAGLGLLETLLVPCLAENPLWSGHSVGSTPIWNALLYVYGVPAALALLFAFRLRSSGYRAPAAGAGAASIVIFFIMISLQVRQAFHGEFLGGASPSGAEGYAYSAAWIVFGLALLLIGIASRGMVARYASLAVMLAAIAKVFLYDTRELRDLYRVFSFLGLGVSLFLLAFLYQRFVFRRKDPCAPQ